MFDAGGSAGRAEICPATTERSRSSTCRTSASLRFFGPKLAPLEVPARATEPASARRALVGQRAIGSPARAGSSTRTTATPPDKYL